MMVSKRMKGLKLALVAGVVGLLGSASAHAGVLQIQFSGMDWTYSNGFLTDAADPNGSFGDPAESDPLITMSFILDGVVLGTFLDNIWFDAGIDAGPLAVAGTSSGSGGFFDILTQNATPGWGLALDLGDWEITTAANNEGITISMNGTLTNADIFSQFLPFGLSVVQPIVVSFSSNNVTNVTSADGFLTGFNASGTGEIIGTTVPEPGALLLFGAGLMGLGFSRKLKKAA